MCRFTFLLIAFCLCVFVKAQNQDLERLLHKYRNNPAIEYVNMLDSFPDAKQVKVAETMEFGDSIYLVRHFVEDYEKINGFHKLKATKVLSFKGSPLMKMALNKAITVRQWTSADGYKDTVMEFDGCSYIIIHIGGFYENDELANLIIINTIPHQKHKHREPDAQSVNLSN